MSGAEALLVVGVVSNVVQFVDFGAKLYARIKEYSTAATGAPKKIKDLAEYISLVSTTLTGLSESGRAVIEHEQTTIQKCLLHAQELDALLDQLKLKSPAGAAGMDGLSWLDRRKSNVEKFWKAFKSIHGESKIEEFQVALQRLFALISFQLQSRTIAILEGHTRQLGDMDASLSRMSIKEAGEHAQDKTVFLVPFSRNPVFVGRDDVLEKLDQKLTPKRDIQPKAVLCGLGGIGKTQLALEHAYRCKDRSPDCSVFWVHAGNSARFQEAFDKIATTFDIPGRGDPDADPLQLVQNWLEDVYRRPWLMVIDNADDPVILWKQRGPGKCLSEYIPRSAQGAILYTSRNRDVAVDVAGEPIDVPLMSLEEGKKLLGVKVVGIDNSEDDQLELLTELEYLPLAISQAAAFMLKRRKTIAQYLTLYRANDSARVRLLSHQFTDDGREARQMESVITTWSVSFEYIRSENTRAAELLSLMSFLDRRGIPSSLLVRDEEDPFEFEDAIGVLVAFSMIEANQSGDSSYDMHRLVQLAARAWFMSRDVQDAEKIACETLKLLAERFPFGQPHNWPTCAAYLPHAEMALNQIPEGPVQDLEIARGLLYYRVSSYLVRYGRFQAAREAAEACYRVRLKVLGIEHLGTLESLSDLGWVLQNMGEYEEAERLARYTLQKREELLGPTHHWPITSAFDLSMALHRRGKYEEAEALCRRACTAREADEGPNGYWFLVALAELGRILDSRGKAEEAEQVTRRALHGRAERIGEMHPETLCSLSDLGVLLQHRGRSHEAEEISRRALNGRIFSLGLKYHDTLTSVSNLGWILQSPSDAGAGGDGDSDSDSDAQVGRYNEAECLHRLALQERTELLGTAHPDTLTSLHLLGVLLGRRRRFDEAESFLRQALVGRDARLGRDHRETWETRQNLEMVFQRRTEENRVE